MRAFLILLAIAVPVVLANPLFWHLVAMKFSVAEVVYEQHDGTMQRALLGPAAPWPAWAAIPEGTQLRVRSHFDRAPGRAAVGQGEVHGFASTATTIGRYRAALEADGWIVRLSTLETLEPTMPPRPIRLCQLEATRIAPDSRALLASFRIHEEAGHATLMWIDGPRVPSLGMQTVASC